MTRELNRTHDPALRSWVKSAGLPDSDFPIQNLPFGVFRRLGEDESRVGVAIGDQILDVPACQRAGLCRGPAEQAASSCYSDSLNPLMALGPEAWEALRNQLVEILAAGSGHERRAGKFLVPMSQAEMKVPACIGDYTDFYASVFHATNVGSMFRPDSPLLPNYKYVPIGYHGRASSIVVSGAAIRRPAGQLQNGSQPPAFAPSRLLDYELEVGCFVGPGNALGEPIPIIDAERHLFGLCLVNDWSARDIQKWEYQPLGPFLAKNFATSISPWVVTLEALAPFRVPAFARPEGDPAPLPYLNSGEDQARGGVDLQLEVYLQSARMREQSMPAVRLSGSSFRDMYWTFAQMLAHHASNGCNLRPGDLLASGTVSGAEESARGCLLEMTRGGAEPITLPTGEERRFLADGDEVTFRGFCARPGFARIGLGACRGTILPQ